MNKNISADKLLGAGIIIGVIIMFVWMISSGIRKAEKELKEPAKKEAIKERGAAAGPGYVIPHNIFPTDDEGKKNIKSQQEREQALNKSLTERRQIAAEIRKNVDASLSEQLAPATGQLSAKATTTSPSKQVSNPVLKKSRIEKFKNRELFIHH